MFDILQINQFTKNGGRTWLAIIKNQKNGLHVKREWAHVESSLVLQKYSILFFVVSQLEIKVRSEDGQCLWNTNARLSDILLNEYKHI